MMLSSKFRILSVTVGLFILSAAYGQIPLTHVGAIKSFLIASRAPEISLAPLHNYVVDLARYKPQEAKELKHLIGKITEKDMLERLVPIYAKYVDEITAFELARFYESSVGQKIVLRELMLLKSSEDVPLNLTDKEKTYVETFSRSNAYKVMRVALPKIGEEVRTLGQEMLRELTQVSMRKKQ